MLDRKCRIMYIMQKWPDVTVAQLLAFARLCQAFGEFAARGQLVGHGYDVLIKRAFQEFEIILCRGVLGLADIGLITNDADTTQNADDCHNHQKFDQGKPGCPHSRPLSARQRIVRF